MQLQQPAFAVFTFVGVVVGSIGWSVVRRRATQPRAVLRWLVPVTLLVLFVPDILLGLGREPWSTVVSLLVMHVAMAAVAVVTYLRALPLD